MKKNSVRSISIVGLLFFVNSLGFAADSFSYYDKVLKDTSENKVITSGSIAKNNKLNDLLKSEKDLISDTQREYDEAVLERDEIARFMEEVKQVQADYEKNISKYTEVTNKYIKQKGKCRVMKDEFDIEFRGEKTQEEQEHISNSLYKCNTKLDSLLDKYNSSDDIMYKIYFEMNRLTRLAKIKQISAKGLDGFIESFESLKKFFEGVNYENSK